MCKKYELASPGAPADHADGATKADPEVLRRRAEAAAEAAALRYRECCDGRVHCTLYGELIRKPKDWPRLSDCERDPQRWRIPARADRICLLFKWDIVEHGRVTASDNSFVTLNKAEQQGVPLPDDWERLIADVADRVAAVAGVALP